MGNPRQPQTFVERATRMADRARTLRARAGATPWRTFVVAYRWNGGEVGRGVPEFERFHELTPPPEILGEDGLRTRTTTVGMSREGHVRMVGISARYTEDDLDLLFGVSRDREVFIEVIHDGREGSTPERRAYKPVSVPMRDVTGAQWTLDLTKSQDDRSKYGDRRFWTEEP